jgi:hypothetical protein
VTIKEKLAANEAAQDRWLRKLTRAANAITKLRQQRSRLQKSLVAKASKRVAIGTTRRILLEAQP